MSDPGSTYRTREEIEKTRQERDPVERVRKLIIENGFAEAAELKATEKRIKDEIDTAIKECKAAAVPEHSMLQTNLYMDPCDIQMRGVRSDHWIEATVKPYNYN